MALWFGSSIWAFLQPHSQAVLQQETSVLWLVMPWRAEELKPVRECPSQALGVLGAALSQTCCSTSPRAAHKYLAAPWALGSAEKPVNPGMVGRAAVAGRYGRVA